jgi:hypothetical protein
MREDLADTFRNQALVYNKLQKEELGAKYADKHLTVLRKLIDEPIQGFLDADRKYEMA